MKRYAILMVVCFSFVSVGCTTGQIQRLREGIDTVADGVNAGDQAVDVVLANAEPGSKMHNVATEAKKHTGPAVPAVKKMQKEFESVNDFPGVLTAFGKTVGSLPIPYAGPIGSILGIGGLIAGWFQKRKRVKQENTIVQIIKGVDAGKNPDGVIDFKDANTKRTIAAVMGPDGRKMVAAAKAL